MRDAPATTLRYCGWLTNSVSVRTLCNTEYRQQLKEQRADALVEMSLSVGDAHRAIEEVDGAELAAVVETVLTSRRGVEVQLDSVPSI